MRGEQRGEGREGSLGEERREQSEERGCGGVVAAAPEPAAAAASRQAGGTQLVDRHWATQIPRVGLEITKDGACAYGSATPYVC